MWVLSFGEQLPLHDRHCYAPEQHRLYPIGYRFLWRSPTTTPDASFALYWLCEIIEWQRTALEANEQAESGTSGEEASPEHQKSQSGVPSATITSASSSAKSPSPCPSSTRPWFQVRVSVDPAVCLQGASPKECWRQVMDRCFFAAGVDLVQTSARHFGLNHRRVLEQIALRFGLSALGLPRNYLVGRGSLDVDHSDLFLPAGGRAAHAHTPSFAAAAAAPWRTDAAAELDHSEWEAAVRRFESVPASPQADPVASTSKSTKRTLAVDPLPKAQECRARQRARSYHDEVRSGPEEVSDAPAAVGGSAHGAGDLHGGHRDEEGRHSAATVEQESDTEDDAELERYDLEQSVTGLSYIYEFHRTPLPAVMALLPVRALSDTDDSEVEDDVTPLVKLFTAPRRKRAEIERDLALARARTNPGMAATVVTKSGRLSGKHPNT
mmetsp:Transcript_52006/g.130577  ORF Transcript_52006/g.130577 Transcript_52006/m.130577 type:complete len:438 (+) Transcript_52006:78-1391(+)